MNNDNNNSGTNFLLGIIIITLLGWWGGLIMVLIGLFVVAVLWGVVLGILDIIDYIKKKKKDL